MFTQIVEAGSIKVMLAGRANSNYFEKVIQEYRKSHKDTKITPIYMDWEDQAGALSKRPDVYVGPRNFLASNIDLGIFEDLAKLLPKKTVKSFLPELLYSCSIREQLYGIPLFGYCTSLTYNKGQFKTSGLAAPDSTWSWEGKFYQACRKLSQNKSGTGVNANFGFVGLPTNNFRSLFYSYGGSFPNRNANRVTYTDKAGMGAIDFILKLNKEKVV